MPRRTKQTDPSAIVRKNVTVTLVEDEAIRAAADDPARWHYAQTQGASFEALARRALEMMLGVSLPPVKRGAPEGNQNAVGNPGNKRATGRKKKRAV